MFLSLRDLRGGRHFLITMARFPRGILREGGSILAHGHRAQSNLSGRGGQAVEQLFAVAAGVGSHMLTSKQIRRGGDARSAQLN